MIFDYYHQAVAMTESHVEEESWVYYCAFMQKCRKKMYKTDLSCSMLARTSRML